MNTDMEKVLDDYLEKLIQSCTVSIDTCPNDSEDNDFSLDNL